MSEHLHLLEILAQNVPAAVAVIFTVWLFLRERSKASREFQQRMVAAADECHTTQNRGTEALLKHAEASAAQNQALNSQAQLLQQLVLVVTKCQGFGEIDQD